MPWSHEKLKILESGLLLVSVEHSGMSKKKKDKDLSKRDFLLKTVLYGMLVVMLIEK